MSWNLERKTRKEIVEVREILLVWTKLAADFPGMRILDQKGREHEFSHLDLGITTLQEWNEIQVGSKIELTLKEKIVRARLLPKEIKSSAESDI